MKYISFNDFFTVLGNEQRVKILQLLSKNGPMNVLSIADKLQVEQSAISHSLRKLLSYHFVTVKQSGKERIYTIEEDTVHPMFNLIEEHVKKNCAKECKHW